MKIMLMNVEMLIEDLMFVFILSNSFFECITLSDGIKTMLMLPMIDMGTKSIGKVMPITTPKHDMASLDV